MLLMVKKEVEMLHELKVIHSISIDHVSAASANSKKKTYYRVHQCVKVNVELTAFLKKMAENN